MLLMEMLHSRMNTRALGAAGFAVLALLSTIPFWTSVFIEWPNPSIHDLGDFYTTYVEKMSAGVGLNVLAVVLLGVPLLSGYGVRHLRALAVLCAIGIASLFFLYDTYWFGAVFALSSFPDSGTPVWWQLVAIIGMFADPVSVGFAVATAFGAHRPRQGGVPAT